MIPYITYRENDSEGRLCYFILQKDFPHFVGLLSTGKLDTVLASSPIAGYNLWINFNGCLRGNVIPSYKNIIDEIEKEMSSMAIWFYNNRILVEPKKYERFKIKAHDSISK